MLRSKSHTDREQASTSPRNGGHGMRLVGARKLRAGRQAILTSTRLCYLSLTQQSLDGDNSRNDADYIIESVKGHGSPRLNAGFGMAYRMAAMLNHAQINYTQPIIDMNH
jgi:hypothetical protein